ncbi:MAG: hypothetical protein ACPHO6_14205, partial [Candidatus Latescibacterota bacterium]
MSSLFFLLFTSLPILCGLAEAKGGYNVWAKEKIRYLNSRIIRDPYNPQLRLLMANAYIEDGR